jgi:hypothetical protein
MSNLIEYAKRELELAGYFDPKGVYGGMLGTAVLTLIETFSEEGHSGMSASIAISVFERVARFEPLTPLTGADDEWYEPTPGTFQNIRCPHVFKENGEAYDIEGRIFRDPDGSCFQSKDSRVPVTFPYTPKREYIDRPAE